MDCIQTEQQAARQSNTTGFAAELCNRIRNQTVCTVICHKVMLFSVSVFIDADYSVFTNQIVKELESPTRALKTKNSLNEWGCFGFRVSATGLMIQFGTKESTAGDKFSYEIHEHDGTNGEIRDYDCLRKA